MKIEEFKKYRKIAESLNEETLEKFPEAKKIREWLEHTDRIDEGLFGSIWGWLKKHFSITARKLINLANEYEKELMAETIAEWKKHSDKDDLASKFRAGSYARLSRDIEEKMEIVAKDDPEYRELVRALINEKNLLVKRAVIRQFTGVLDPSIVRRVNSENDRDLKNANAKTEDVFNNLTLEGKKKYKTICDFLAQKIVQNNKQYAEIKIVSSDSKQEFIKIIASYVNSLSEKYSDIKFDTKSALKIANQFIETVKEISKKLESKDVSLDDAIEEVKSILYTHLTSSKLVQIDKIKNDVFKQAQSKLESSGIDKDTIHDVEDEVTTQNTDVVMTNDEIEDSIIDAAEDTEEENPTVEDIVKEIEDSSTEYFNKNLKTYTLDLNTKIKEFNKLSEEERNNFNYLLNDKNELEIATEKDVKVLFNNLVTVAGAVVPYFNLKKGKRAKSFYYVLDYLFQIYACKKDPQGKLSTDVIDDIIENIKRRNENI
jgi:hypothetical protein